MIQEIYAVDLEEEILSHLADPESVKLFRAERVPIDLIEDDDVAEIYKWQMAHVKEHGRPATPSVLADEFGLEFSEPLTAAGDLIDRLRARYVRNNAQRFMGKVADAYKADPQGVPATMVRVGREFSEVVSPRGETYTHEDYQRVIDDYDKRATQGPGASFGFEEFDDYFYGMRGVNVWLGAPKSYKSWFVINAALGNILQGRKVSIASLELPAVESTQRLYALAANISPWKWLKGGLTIDDRRRLKEVSETLEGSGLFEVTKPKSGQRTIDEIVDAARANDAEVIFIDQMQYVEYNDNGRNLGAGSHQDYWDVLNKARDYSDDGPICFVHQFNRTVMNSDKMPEMQQAKGAAAVEEIASLCLGLWANKDMRRSGVVECGALASRHFIEQSWEIQIDLSRGCSFACMGPVEHEDDSDS
jgi:archaellum biogenesis ATPase FlaH